MLWSRGLQIPRFDKSNLFIRRIANPSKLQATFKSTLHPSPLFTHSSPGKSALFYRPNRSSFRFNSVRNPWSKNALLTQRNPMNKNIQVKSGLREFSGIMQKLFPYRKYQVGVQFLRWF